jgi:hypothetical protein
MKQTVTIEIADNSVLQLLRSLAAMSLVRFFPEMGKRRPVVVTL